MSEETMIKTFCTKCGMVYDLDRSLIGQFGECAGCGAAFEITDQTDYVIQMLAAQASEAPAEQQAPAEEQQAPAEQAAAPEAPAVAAPAAPESAPEPVAQEGDVVMNRGDDDESAPTNTVKLSRVSRAGMLPEVKDNPFKVGTVNVGTQTVIGATHGSRRFSDKKFTFARASSSSTASRKKHWWEFWKM